jgi:hypothetical protein
MQMDTTTRPSLAALSTMTLLPAGTSFRYYHSEPDPVDGLYHFEGPNGEKYRASTYRQNPLGAYRIYIIPA